MGVAERHSRDAAARAFTGQRPFWRVSESVRWVLAGCTLVAVLGLGNIDLLVRRSAPQWDAVDYFGPEFSLIADHIKSGRLLLWDPWVAAGTPDSAEPEFGTTSPIVLVMGLLSPNPRAGFVMYWMFIWMAGPIGLLVLCRHLKCPVWGGLIAAIGFGASGFYTGHAEHTAHLYSVSFLPWIIWRFDLALSRRSYWGALQAGILYGLSALGGYPVYTIVTPGFLVLWSAARAFDNDDGKLPASGWRRRLWVSAAAILLLTAVGGAVMSPAYIGFFKETRGYSDRTGPRSREEALTQNILPVGDLTTLASPYLSLLDIEHGRFWPFSDISMRSIYVGSLVTTLAFFGLLGGRRWRSWLFSIAILFLCCATGYQLVIRAWLYDFLPPTRYFRNASSFRTYFILLFAILAALGAKDLNSVTTSIESSPRKRHFFICSIVMAIIVGWTFAIVTHLARVFPPSYGFATIQAIIVWCAAAALAYLLWDERVPRTTAYGLLLAVALFDGITTLRISRITMHSPGTVSFWRVMKMQHDPSLDLSAHRLFRQLDPPAMLNNFPPSRYPSNRNLPLKIATLNNDITLWNRFYRQIQDDPLLCQMALGKDRIWFAAQAAWGPPSDANFVDYARRVHQLQSAVVILHTAEQMKSLSMRSGGQRGTTSPAPVLGFGEASRAQVSQISYWPNSLSFHYFASTGGWLIVTDRWAPGWKATVNGQPREVLGADFVFRAVRVEPGDNFVQFQYRPWGWPGLLVLSWGTLLVAGVWQIRRVTASFGFASRNRPTEASTDSEGRTLPQ